MIDWNLEAKYSRRYFDKHFRQQGPNERVERQARVGLREFYVGPGTTERRLELYRVQDTVTIGIGTKIPIILPDRRQAEIPQ